MAAPNRLLQHRPPLVCKSGEIVLSHEAPLLATLGSCVGLIVHDRQTGLFGLNHYLLPDPSASSRNSSLGELEFGSVSIPTLFRKMKEFGSKKENVDLWVVGGASQFKSNSEVGRANIAIAEQLITQLGLQVLGTHVGGTLGRRVEVNITKMTISVWLLNGSASRQTPTETFPIPT